MDYHTPTDITNNCLETWKNLGQRYLGWGRPYQNHYHYI